MEFFINGYKKNGETVNYTVKTEDKAIAIVDSAVANGLKYVSVIAITDKENDVAFEQGHWDYHGTTLDDKSVWLMLIEETYNG